MASKGMYDQNKEVLTQQEVFALGKIDVAIAQAKDPHEAYKLHKKYTNTYESFMAAHNVRRT